ncbi:hypothetical protein C8F01DRAFT_1264198 [Mycena amicta]|nr:hypothetical protein C8F01DRAFT_1264198 [Mycena amicta]
MSDSSASLVAGYSGDASVQEIMVLRAIGASILATRFASAVAPAALFYDHALTFGDELELIWFNPLASRASRVGFLLNSCQAFIWIFAVSSITFVAASHFVLMSRVYTLWEQRRTIKWILTGSSVAGMATATMFFILTAVQLQKMVVYSPVVRMCLFTGKPWATDFSLGTLTVFDLFIILLTIANGLHRPYKKESEVLLALVRDGALMFLALFALRLINLMMGLFGNPANTFITMIFIWSMCSVVSSRMQLRIEGLNLQPKSPEQTEGRA